MKNLTLEFSVFLSPFDEYTQWYFKKIASDLGADGEYCERQIIDCFRRNYKEMYQSLSRVMSQDDRTELPDMINNYMLGIGYDYFFIRLINGIENRWYRPYLEKITLGYLEDIERYWFSTKYKVQIANKLDLVRFKKARALVFIAKYAN
jgi:hypothetical protein